jgi:RNA-directed DNA polymerase
VEVHCDEGVATRIDPESCTAAREGRGEALTGERAGWVLSRESPIPGADPVSPRGRRDDLLRQREWQAGPARSPTPCMPARSLHGSREISGLAANGLTSGPHREGRRG